MLLLYRKKNIHLYNFLFLIIILISYIFSWNIVDQNDQKELITVIFLFFIIFNITLWRLSLIDRGLPIFNIGFVLISISILYSLYPIFTYALSGFKWTVISDTRMWDVSTEQLKDFSLFHLSYIVALVSSFLIIMKKSKINNVSYVRENIKNLDLFFIFFVYFGIEVYFLLIKLEIIRNTYFTMQLNHNFSTIKSLITVAILYVASCNWQKTFYKSVAMLILFFELIYSLLGYSGRTYFFILMLSFLMIYHKNIRTISYKVGIIIFCFLLFVFTVWGYYKTNVFLSPSGVSLLSGTNEFTSIYATAFELSTMLHDNFEIPTSIKYNDFFLLIPSQLLSIEKWSTAQWYLEIKGLRGQGVGSGFGVIAQGVIGSGISELIIRGSITGLFFGLIHNFYIKHSDSLWVNVIYIFLALRSYHIFRAGNGYIIYDLIYVVMPILLLLFIMRESQKLILHKPKEFKLLSKNKCVE